MITRSRCGQSSAFRSRAPVAPLLLIAVLPALALDISKLQPQGYVSDFANVVDSASKTQLERYLTTLEQATGAQVALVTVDSLDGDPIDDTANALFRKWGIGVKGKNEGVLLLLAVRDRKSRVEVGYGLEPILPDGFTGSVLREMRPSLRAGQYGQALIAGAGQIGQTIAQSKGVSLDRSLPRRAAPRGGSQDVNIPWPMVIVGIIILFALISRGGGGFLTWLLLSSLTGGGGRYRGGGDGGWGGGGFGGGGSGGGGFGGFGGGDSGGGGASSDW